MAIARRVQRYAAVQLARRDEEGLNEVNEPESDLAKREHWQQARRKSRSVARK
jgi:hypothetical protein